MGPQRATHLVQDDRMTGHTEDCMLVEAERWLDVAMQAVGVAFFIVSFFLLNRKQGQHLK